MFKFISVDLEGEHLEKIDSMFSTIESQREVIEKSLRRIDKTKSELEVYRKELVKILTMKLDTIRNDHFLTLSDFLYPTRPYTQLNKKWIKEDFLFLFYDSLKKPHVLHVEDMTALYINQRVKSIDSENVKVYTESEIRKNIEKIMNTRVRKNWMCSLERADSLHILRQDGVLTVPTLFYLSNFRRTHSKMKINNCFVFRRNPETKQLFKVRDAILKIKEYRDR